MFNAKDNTFDAIFDNDLGLRQIYMFYSAIYYKARPQIQATKRYSLG